MTRTFRYMCEYVTGAVYRTVQLKTLVALLFCSVVKVKIITEKDGRDEGIV
jgi:hypothetical protein